jgi:pSer/pThr/pTyr-binding forkhead associated (FHA) protein
MAKLYIMEGPHRSQSIELKDKPIYIGRSPDNDIQIKDKTVSRRHLKVFTRDNRYYLEDLDSKNGTYVNGEQIYSGREIEIDEGYPIVIGMSVLCIGEGCLESVRDYLNSINVAKATRDMSQSDAIIIGIPKNS